MIYEDFGPEAQRKLARWLDRGPSYNAHVLNGREIILLWNEKAVRSVKLWDITQLGTALGLIVDRERAA